MFRRAFFAGVALVGFGAVAVTEADAALTISAVETNGDVVVTIEGSLDITGLEQSTTFNLINGNAAVNASLGALWAGADQDPVDYYVGALAGPLTFGAGGYTFADASTGGPFYVVGGPLMTSLGEAGFGLGLPVGYVANAPIAATLSFFGTTLDDLGMVPGSYATSLLSGDTISMSVVPVPAALPLLATGLVALAVIRRRRAAA